MQLLLQAGHVLPVRWHKKTMFLTEQSSTLIQPAHYATAASGGACCCVWGLQLPGQQPPAILVLQHAHQDDPVCV